MRILVTGANGQLGIAVVSELLKRGVETFATGLGPPRFCAAPYIPLDIASQAEVKRTLAQIIPSAVIHCAAWTRADAAERPENAAEVRAVNVDGTRYLAQACEAVGSKLVYVSTDCVFDGQGTRPWKADGEEFRPVNFYGQTKLEGEQEVRRYLEKYFIVRTSWLFGIHGSNFIASILKLGRERDSVQVVKDQTGTPTYARDLARLLVDLTESEKYGCYHAANEGDYVTKYGLALEVFRQAGCTARVTAVTSGEYGPYEAVRPLNSRLDRSKLAAAGFAPLPDWRDAVSRYLAELG